MNWRLAPAVCVLAVSLNVFANTGPSATARKCGVDQQRQPPQRVFADSDGKHGWREYRSVKDVPELTLGFGESALLWTGRDDNTLVSTYEPGEDFAAYTDYCFSKNGQLVQLRFELRTAWGWGYRQEGPIANGAISGQEPEFFSTRTDEPIGKPQQADDLGAALKPCLYLRKSQLPFSKLLAR